MSEPDYKDDEVRRVEIKRGEDIVVFILPDAPRAKWNRQPQEQDGDYWFGGRFYVTRGVAAELSQAEILWIVADLQQAVAAKSGLDYLQVYLCEDGRKVWLIDQLSRSMLRDYSPTDQQAFNYFTMLLPSEY